MYVNLDGHHFLYSSSRPVHYLFIYSICLFIYIIIIFSPKRRYILCKKNPFFNDWNISETWTRNKLLSLKTTATARIFLWKKMHFFGGKEVTFSVGNCWGNSLTFNPYFLGKHIQHFTWSSWQKTNKTLKQKQKQIKWNLLKEIPVNFDSVKNLFLRRQHNCLFNFFFFLFVFVFVSICFFVLVPGLCGLPVSLNELFKIDFVWLNKHQGVLRSDYINSLGYFSLYSKLAPSPWELLY